MYILINSFFVLLLLTVTEDDNFITMILSLILKSTFISIYFITNLN